MNRNVRLVALTAVLALGVVGGLYYNYLRSPQSVGGPDATPSPTAPQPSPSPAVTSLGTATLSNDGCELQPAPAPATPGRASIELVNESRHLGGYELLKIQPGSSFDDLVAHVETENERLEEFGSGVNLSPPLTTGQYHVVSSGESAVRPVSVEAGTYGMVCFPLQANNRTGGPLYLVGPIEIE